jgi:hypothetical protein
MMDSSTSPAFLSALPDIAEKPEDTPSSVGRERRIPSMGVLALPLALATMMTSLTASRDPFQVAQDMTALAEEARGEEWSSLLPATTSSFEEVSEVSDAEAANHTRLTLLARQYVAGKLSIEEEARLAIVAERVRRLIPRVTVEDFEALERILEEAEHIESTDIERRQRLGID